MTDDAYDPSAIRVLAVLTPPRRPVGFLTIEPEGPVSPEEKAIEAEAVAECRAVRREILLLKAAALMPEEERADIVSLIDAGEWAEAAFQMRGGPGDRAIPPEALALIERAEALP